MAEVLSNTVKTTQNILGTYVVKPPLTDKLLSKPPFRFLHDLLNAVITGHGLFNGLYTDEELDYKNIKDKDAKVSFLQKCIDATSLATGATLTVRPSKIVGGHEADKTNEWLQLIGKLISEQIDTTDAVEQVLAGVKPTKPKKPSDKDKTDKKTDKDKIPRNVRLVKNFEPKPGKSIKTVKEIKPSRPKGPPNINRTPSTGSIQDKSRKLKPKNKNKEDKTKDGESSKNVKERRNKDDKVKNKSSKDEQQDSKRDRDKQRSSKNKDKDKQSKVKDDKENSPPHQVLEGATALVNGHQSPDIQVPTLPQEQPESQFGMRSMVDDAGIGSGPASLLQIENGGIIENVGNQQEGTGLIGFDAIPDGVDSAILKAMDPNSQLDASDQGGNTSDPPDSGVGFLESPIEPSNSSTDNQSGPVELQKLQIESTNSKAPSPRGSVPLKALEQFDGAVPIDQPITSTKNEEFERPKTGSGIRPRTGLRSARPPSARPAPPKVRERREIPKEEIPRPATSKPVANIILDTGGNDGQDDDDDETFMVDDTKPVISDELLSPDKSLLPHGGSNIEEQQQLVEEGGEGAGLLVAQILETKKELEDGRKAAFSPETPGHRRVQIEQALQSDASRRKDREIIQKDVQKLSGSIQTLTRSVNPLAKMLDYLQEDLDSMQKELENWRGENKQLSQTLKREQGKTSISLEPLQAQQKDLETSIFEQQDKISAVKSSIARNSDRISRLMAGINLHS